MKNIIKKIHFLLILISIFITNSLWAMKRFSSSRTGQSYVGKYVRPNSKSSLRYYSVSPDRSRCISTKLSTSSASKRAFTPKRDLSISQIGTGLWKATRWQLTSNEDKKAELFRALLINISNNNTDNSLSSIIALLNKENLLNEQQGNGSSLTPLEFAIENSGHKDYAYQANLIKALVENGAQLHGTKELKLALKNYNIGAIKALLPYSTTFLSNFFTTVKETLESKKEALENANDTLQDETISELFRKRLSNRKKSLQETIRNLTKIERLLENSGISSTKSSFLPYEKESELK